MARDVDRVEASESKYFGELSSVNTVGPGQLDLLPSKRMGKVRGETHDYLVSTGIGLSQIVLEAGAADVSAKGYKGAEGVPMNGARAIRSVHSDGISEVSSPSVRNTFCIGRDVIRRAAHNESCFQELVFALVKHKTRQEDGVWLDIVVEDWAEGLIL